MPDNQWSAKEENIRKERGEQCEQERKHVRGNDDDTDMARAGMC